MSLKQNILLYFSLALLPHSFFSVFNYGCVAAYTFSTHSSSSDVMNI